MRTIAIINQKGGCGKTTTAINMAACLAGLDRRVLLIDLDPQGHASLGLNLKPENLSKGMMEVLTQGTYLEDVICEAVSPNLDLAPANITLSAVEPLLSKALQREKRLLTAIRTLKRRYDYIIIDSPPSLGLLTFNALRASAEAIVPVETSFFSLHGLAKLSEIVDVVVRHTGHQVAVRALATMVNYRTRFGQEIVAEIQRHFEGRFFKTMIRNNVRLREAASHGKPIIEYEPRANGALDYTALASEVIALEKAPMVDVAAAQPATDVPRIEVEKYLGPIMVEEILNDPTKPAVYRPGANG